MLILTRRLNEAVMIGDNIEIRILEIKGSQVRLGVTAPRDVVVDREEIALKRAAERAETK